MRIALAAMAAGAALLAVAGVPASTAHAAGLSVTALSDSGTATSLAQSLAGDGVSISNATVTGPKSAVGSFTGGASAFGPSGIDAGVALSTGYLGVETPPCDPNDPNCVPTDGCPNSLLGPNDESGATCDNGGAGDPALDALLPSGQTTNDATVLEFDVTPNDNALTFNFVFGSEEYNEFVGSPFNDVFGLFIDDVNCALVPGTTATPCTPAVSGQSAITLPD